MTPSTPPDPDSGPASDGDRPESREMVEAVFRTESRRVLATLIRILGDFEVAEDALQEAFTAAVEQWPEKGVPTNPRAWLVSTGRHRAIDALRRKSRYDEKLGQLTRELEAERALHDPPSGEGWDGQDAADDQLRLIFTCCHPALAPEAQVALTLREICGLTTEEIARAFLTSPPTLAQRIVRAKRKIRDVGIPYEVPERSEMPERLEGVLRVIYLVFNEGYSASFGDSLTRADLSNEAIRLGRLLVELLPEPEATGLLALMLLHESRRKARSTPDGALVLLEDQDRSLWDRDLIAEGLRLVHQAVSSGPYTLQAAIAAAHAEAASAAETDWSRIVALYDALLQVDPSPVVSLNRSVAVAMRDGPETGLALVEEVLAGGELDEYHLAHAVRADLLRRLGRAAEARAAYTRALELVRQDPERRFLEARLQEVSGP